jgi:hypothetical protein
MEFLGGSRIRQCHQATAVLGSHGCCGGNQVLLSGDCDFPWVPQFTYWGFDYDHSENALSWTQVQSEISIMRRPFAFVWTSLSTVPANTGLSIPGASATPPVNHMLVVIGYGTDPTSGVNVVVAYDPSPVRATQAVMVPFTDYQGLTGTHAHAEDYWGIRQ